MKAEWLLSNPNKLEIQKVLDKRTNLIFDITMNNKYIPDYQRKLMRYTKTIERLYKQGLKH